MPMHVVLHCHNGLLLDSYATLMQVKVCLILQCSV